MRRINFKLIFTVTIIYSFLSCKAQTLPLNTALWDIPSNAYLKDLNNELLPYVGIYKAIYQGNEITLHITLEEHKVITSTKKNFFQDVLNIRYIIKNSSGTILQDNQNNTSINKLYSTGTWPAKGIVEFFYSGTSCNVGWGNIDLSKISSTQIKWNYLSQESDPTKCPPGTDFNIYLPEVENLIFTKQ